MSFILDTKLVIRIFEFPTKGNLKKTTTTTTTTHDLYYVTQFASGEIGWEVGNNVYAPVSNFKSGLKA